MAGDLPRGVHDAGAGDHLGRRGVAAPVRVDWVGRPAPPPAGCTVGIADGDLIERARRLEYDVFLDQGYCEPSEDHRIAEYAPWEDRSRFHVVVTDDDQLIAAVRTTAGAYAGLPVGKFERDVAYPPDPVIEYASLVVPKDARKVGGAEALYRSVVHEALVHGAGGLVAIGEAWLLDLLNDVYDFGFRQLGPSRWYMGGECFPMGTSMKDLLHHLGTRQPTLLDWFLEEIDLRQVPDPEWADARRPPAVRTVRPLAGPRAGRERPVAPVPVAGS